jgi:N-acylglucosamine-6-phosphate 2-epimerase
MVNNVGGSAEGISTAIAGGLIVSCQALPDEPLFGPDTMARLAIAAASGGAVGIRANTPIDIAAIRAVTTLPLIGLWKVVLPGYDVYITPRLSDAVAVADAGADVIAIDATARTRPEEPLALLIQRIHDRTGKPVLADISTFEEAIAAQDFGADFVSTTMSGYTSYSPQNLGPDFDLIRRLAPELTIPLLAEGRISSPEEARLALDSGAFAVVVGGAITRPQQITKRYIEAIEA